MLFRFCDQIIQHRVITGVVAVRSGDLAAFSRHMLNLRLAVGRTTLRTRLNQGAEIVMPFVMDEIAKVQLLVLPRAGALQCGKGFTLIIARQRMIGRCRRRLVMLCSGAEQQIVIVN
ncbi:Uncharacterised protein [Leclercia adecarboxylata]|nr:Uncharacterised protein [Leclercia adecarboxylata]